MDNMIKRVALTHVTACLFACLLASPALAIDKQDTVINKYKSVVVSTNGACVRTKWESKSDACAPTPAPKLQPAAVIEKDKRTVYFDFNKDSLRPEALKTLDQLVSLIHASGKVTSIHVVGYVDLIGGDSKQNVNLSQKRADAVKNYLAGSLKIPSDASVRGLGVSHTAECSKKAKRSKRIVCLQPDRRVEVELTYKKE